MTYLLPLLFTSLLPLGPSGDPEVQAPDPPKWGHSHLGKAYDEGPRQKPWPMPGIGQTHFPVTTSHPEVQQWFDQGNTLLHGFWWFEAERSFRWCLKLDPDCAMAYWGLARCDRAFTGRGKEFLAEAAKRKQLVTPRERAYIEVWEAKAAMLEANEDQRVKATETFVRRFDQLLMDHPDDLEAKALYWLEMDDLGGNPDLEYSPNRFGMEAVFQEVLAQDPDHIGALHYRIHNWDGKDGRYAIDSCMKLPGIAPDCGHLQHMPGHVLSGIGLWHEAAIAMDSATRVEKRYMHERMILPEQNWNYVHNLDYLCYIQEQLGMVDAALLGAAQQQLSPPALDSPWLATIQKLPTYRALLKFERWDAILDGATIGWDDANPVDTFMRAFAEGRAHLGLGDVEAAHEKLDELSALRKTREERAKDPDGDPDAALFRRRLGTVVELQELLLRGLLQLADGESLEGIQTLTECATLQEQHWWNDPPQQAYYAYNVLGEAYLELGSERLAIESFERTLETVFYDGFALSGLVRAHAALGEVQEAAEALAALKVVWSDADRPNRWLDAALATGIEAEPHLDAPIEQRNYKREVLDVLGPSLWSPPPAPELAVLDSKGEKVTLADYAGRNLILIFYLGDECLHCMEQIREASQRAETFRSLNTEILAMSKDAPEEIAGYEESDDFDLTLLSDPGFENAVRYHAYDDFEEVELHATVLVDRSGGVHWLQVGGDPFMDFDFLEREVRRLEQGVVHELVTSEGTR